MADTNIKDFSVNWVLFGFLFFCLLTFAINFMFENNPNGFGDSKSMFDDTASSMQGRLLRLPNNTNRLLNITSETNPEISDLGSRDSVATSYGTMGTAKGFFQSSKIFMGWVLTGTAGELLVTVFGGLFGLVAAYWIVKYIRNGI